MPSPGADGDPAARPCQPAPFGTAALALVGQPRAHRPRPAAEDDSVFTPRRARPAPATVSSAFGRPTATSCGRRPPAPAPRRLRRVDPGRAGRLRPAGAGPPGQPGAAAARRAGPRDDAAGQRGRPALARGGPQHHGRAAARLGAAAGPRGRTAPPTPAAAQNAEPARTAPTQRMTSDARPSRHGAGEAGI